LGSGYFNLTTSTQTFPSFVFESEPQVLLAVKRLSKDSRAQPTHIPWTFIAGMRDHLIHGYALIDWDKGWHPANKDIPNLLQKIELLSF